MSRRDAILAQVKRAQALPGTTVRAMQLLRDPHCELHEVTTVIELDPSLTSALLRLANSAWYGSPREVASVRDAVVRLGLRTVLDLVIAASVAPLTAGPVEGYDMPAGLLWEHSVGTALGAVKLADVLSLKAPPALFTAGLLADVGKLLLGAHVEVDAEEIRVLAFDRGISFEVAEQQVLGIDHAEVGAALLATWGLPEDLVQVVRWHHQPSQYPDGSAICDLVHVAHLLCRLEGLGLGAEGLCYAPSAEAVERLGLTVRKCELVVGEILVGLAEAKRVLGGNGSK